MDLMEPIWLMYLAHQESWKKADRVAGAWEPERLKAREQGRPHQNRPPWWIVRKGGHYRTEPGKFKLQPERARIMREVLRLAQEGMGFGRLCQWLTRKG